MMRRWRGGLIALAAQALAGCSDDTPSPGSTGLYEPPPAPVPLVQVSGDSPFLDGCDQQPEATGTLYVASEAEPYVAANPLNPAHFVGVWQQDRWSDGGARGLLAGVSLDGGQTWTQQTVPFSRCTGGTGLDGGDTPRSTDPWVSFAPNGDVHWLAMTFDDTFGSVSTMRASRSVDGGATWSAPITLIEDGASFFNDKGSLTADPTDARFVYAVWDRINPANDSGPAYFARSTDRGVSWEPARAIHDPGSGFQTVGNQVAVLPTGTVLNFFSEIDYASGRLFLKVIHSLDQGQTWLPPVTIAEDLAVGSSDPETGSAIRAGAILGTIAVGPGNRVWVAWQDGRFSGGLRDGIVLTHSDDGGATWTDPVLVNGAPGVQAFTPALAVAADGTVGLTYFDLRDNTPDLTLLTGLWLATTGDGGQTWTERRVSGPFDLRIAPNAYGYFLGDYSGLAATGDSFLPFFVQTYPSLANRTNVYAVALPTVEPAGLTAKVARAGYSARPLPAVVVSAEWRRKIAANVERARHHFPDRSKPAFPPGYLR